MLKLTEPAKQQFKVVMGAETGIQALPALVVNGRLRLVGEMTEKQIRRELEKAKAHRTR